MRTAVLNSILKNTHPHLFWVCVLFMPVYAMAQVKQDSSKTTNEISEFVVTGQYGENSLKNSVYKVRLIDQNRIQRQGAVNLKDVLSNELNIRVSNDGALGSGMSIQGMNGQNVKIMIDGVPVIGREGGSIDLNQINLNNIERVEIVEGPMSVNYGTDALGGVVNLISKKSDSKKLSAGTNLYYESTGKFNAGINTEFSSTKWNLQLNAARNYFDGYNTKDSGRYMTWKPYTQYFGDVNFGYKFKTSSIRFQNGFFDEKVTDRDSGTITPYYAYAIDHYYYTRRITNSVFYNRKINEVFGLDILASYNYYRRISKTVSKNLVTLEENLVPSDQQQDTTYFNNFMSRGTLSANRKNKSFSYQIGYEINYEQNRGSKIEGGKQSIADYNAFGSLEWRLNERLMVKPGLRLIYNSQFDAPLAPSVNLKWDIRDNIALRASYGKGFRAPSLKELYLVYVDPNHNVFGNPDLKAELSNNYQLAVGFEWQASKHVFRLEPSAYYNYLYNKIALVQYQPAGNQGAVYYQYGNVNEFNSTGLNLNTEYRTPRYAFVLGYAYTGVRNILPTAPTASYYFSNEVRFNFNYTFPKQQLNLALFYKYNGMQQMPQLDTKSQEIILGYIDAYSLLDATASKHFWNKRFSLTAGVKNILDMRNVSANMASGVHSDISNSAMVGMGRTFFCSLIFQIESVNN